MDISKRKEVEKTLVLYQKDLEKLVEERSKQLRESERLAAIGATAGMVGHDIRNPLQSIIGEVYLLKSELDSIPDIAVRENLKESLDSIDENIGYINKIVQDLQDFAKPIKPNVQEIDLEVLCQELLLKSRIPKNIVASCEISKNTKKIISDPTLLKRILRNLVDNAVQAMPTGGTLEIKTFRKTDDVIITVQDTGNGVPETARTKLFTPLFTTKAKGQGFGLAVVKRMSENLGGTVTFETETGHGTKFIVKLPLE